MQKKVTQILETSGLIHGVTGHFSWNYPFNELYLHGDILNKESLTIQIADTLHQNNIPFQIYNSHQFRFYQHP